MTANLNTNLGVTLQIVNNSANTTPVNVAVQGIVLGCTVTAYDAYFQVGTSATTYNLPGTSVYFIYVRNLGTNYVSITYAINSGSNQTVQISPVTGGFGGVFLLFQTAESAGVGNITSVSMTANSGVTPVEIAVGY